MRVVVTGGAGFIGSSFVRALLAAEPASEVVVIDAMTYAANPRTVEELAADRRVRVVRAALAERATVAAVLRDAAPDAVVHCAAETHVDRSIDAPHDFVTTNVEGTFHLLEEIRRYLADRAGPFRLLHVSTDEVFGALGPTGRFTEASPYAPRSPYAASKAASDHFVAAYAHTYGVPAIITNCSNNYGPYQFPEKLIPVVITRAAAGEPIPVYGAGDQVRDWIHVADHCAALRAILARGEPGETYVIGARDERRNLDVVGAICDLLDELRPRAGSHRALIQRVADRPGHDFRYALDPDKLERALGWAPTTRFADGLRATVAWYLANPAWLGAARGA
jgi:dTDP-glucose 4,6-dehydratase